MKTFHDWELSAETYEEQRAAGRYNPARQIVIDDGGPTLTIGAGYTDSVYVFTDHEFFHVVSLNIPLGYAGVETFNQEGGGLSEGNAFVQTDHEIESALGKRGIDLAPMTIAKRLLAYVGF